MLLKREDHTTTMDQAMYLTALMALKKTAATLW